MVYTIIDTEREKQMKPLTLKDYDDAKLTKRIEESVRRGWTLSKRGHDTKAQYPYYWAVLHQEWGKK